MFFKLSTIVLSLMIMLSVQAFADQVGKEKELVITWRRLVDQKNQTCPRCSETGGEVEQAVKKIQRAFQHLGVVVKFRSEKISQEEFNKAPLASNRITINGKSLEEWLGGSSGQSPCCASCGDNDCRTVKVDGQEYEAVPERLIIKAALLALSGLF